MFDKQVLIFDKEKPSLRADEKIMACLNKEHWALSVVFLG
jgi:hypothetical protein